MQLQDLLQEIKDLKAQATVDIDPTSPTAGVRMANKKQAKLKLDDAFLRTQKTLLSSAVMIVVTGDDAESFAKVAEKEYEVLSFSANDIYEQIAAEVPEGNFLGRQLNPATVDVISSMTEVLAQNIGITSYTPLVYRNVMSSPTMMNRVDLVNTVKSLHANFVGLEFTGLFFINKATYKVIDSDYKGNTVPVLIYSSDTQYAKQLAQDLTKITNRVALVDTSEVPDESAIASGKDKKSVKEALNKVKQSIRQ